MRHPFEQFLEQFVPSFEKKATQVNKAAWILETTSSKDAADLRAGLEEELRLMLQCPKTYKLLVAWDRDPSLTDPLLKRQLNILIRAFKQNQISKERIAQIAEKEAALSYAYSQFRPTLFGKPVSENEIREVLKNEKEEEKRKAAWCASKEIGGVLGPKILELVQLRNEAAQSLGYSNFFTMQLALQEVDEAFLMQMLEELAVASDTAYNAMLEELKKALGCRGPLLPWHVADPFFQEDPLGGQELDALVQGVDLLQAAEKFYGKMGLDVKAILKRSDNEERTGKNQHAFCMHIDRRGDVRTLNNVKPTIKWLETVLHELGHAVYELGFDTALPWLLREPPHMITTEAMALIAGRQAYKQDSLEHLIGKKVEVGNSLKRRQLIFSRFVLVMTAFERGLYTNPSQDLNCLWWDCVEKYQKIMRPKGREGSSDWAAKYHIGMAPVYYFSYLLGEVFASAIEEKIHSFCSGNTGEFLQDKLFRPGNKMSWNDLICHVTGKPLSIQPWITHFAL
ncbi:MAG: hypothetical protein RLZZ453_633 [Chlamydiota bacterium]|jgi:peptidyl-dipeptidase A